MSKHPFLSRKFLVAVGVIISLILQEFLGLELKPETIAGMIAIGSAYIIGEAAIDWKAVKERLFLFFDEEFGLEEDEEK